MTSTLISVRTALIRALAAAYSPDEDETTATWPLVDAFEAAIRESYRPLLEAARECLEAIATYDPWEARGGSAEVMYDEFAYRRLVESYRTAARAGLAGKSDSRIRRMIRALTDCYEDKPNGQFLVTKGRGREAQAAARALRAALEPFEERRQ